MVLWKKESSNDGAMYVNLWSFQEFAFDDDEKIKQELIRLGFCENSKNDEKASQFRLSGNEKCQTKCWPEAIEMYNKCLRFATAGSENASFAYANRSLCFLKMEMYLKCLDDICLAEYANYPRRLMSKLDERRAFCLKRMISHIPCSFRNEKIKAKLSFGPDEKHPCLANVLEIKTNEEFGRHIVAKNDIGVGENVLSDEFFLADTSQTKNSCCKTCLQYSKNFIPCSGCTDFMFCNTKCMEDNYVHKIVCGTSCYRFSDFGDIVESILLGVTAFSSADDMMKFVECALETRDSIDLPETTSSAQMKYRLFLKLMPSSQSPHESDESNFPVLYLMLMHISVVKQMFDTKSKQRFLMHLIQQHFLIIAENLQESFDGDGSFRFIGTMTPFLNHSCYPNILITSFGKGLVGHIVRSVKRGEQLFSKYVQVDWPTELREAHFQENYQFKCKCTKCLPTNKEIDRVQIQRDPSYQYIARFDEDSIIKGDAACPILLILECYKFMDKYGRLPWLKEIEDVLDTLKICLDLYFSRFILN